MATYHAAECVFDLIAASGPQSYLGLVREVRTQATALWDMAHPATGTELAVDALMKAGIIEHDDEDKYYDLTDYGYSLVK